MIGELCGISRETIYQLATAPPQKPSSQLGFWQIFVELKAVLERAVRTGDIDLVENTLLRASEVDDCRRTGIRPNILQDCSEIALKGRQFEVIDYLLPDDIRISCELIQFATDDDTFELLDILYKHGWRPDPFTLWLAAHKSDERTLEWMLERVASLGVWPEDILRTAAEKCSPRAIDLLLARGLSLKNSWTLHAAARSNTSKRVEMMGHLVTLGCEISPAKASISKSTPVEDAIKYGRVANAMWLLNHGATIDPTFIEQKHVHKTCNADALSDFAALFWMWQQPCEGSELFE